MKKIKNKNFDIEIIKFENLDIKNIIFYEIFKSKFGFCLVASLSDRICNVLFSEDKDRLFLDFEKRWNGFILKNKKQKVHDLVKNYISDDNFSEQIPLYLIGTDFQIKVWTHIIKKSKNKILTYKDIAIDLGDKNLSRAVGGALGKNPIGFLIPCHRVLRTNGSLGGYRWGNEIKEKMLKS